LGDQPAAPGPEPLDGARLTAPLRPGKIVAIGLNYLDHVRESGVEPPQ
jgi:5-carboxymethyl-2-hydroxymuconate isomerase